MALAFYNEIDPHAAQWLRNLISAGHIAPGVVSETDIRDLTPDDLAPYAQCHFFAGIGVWSHAIRRTGWPDDRPVWTGSCPCQPFSAAGRGAGASDERHLWPHWFHLINLCKPAIVLGEQVASKDGLGWLDIVSSDLEGAGYAFGAADLCAAGFGGAHIRQRLYFVGVASPHVQHQEPAGNAEGFRDAGGAGGLGDPGCSGRQFEPDGSGGDGERMGSEGLQSFQLGETSGGSSGLADTRPILGERGPNASGPLSEFPEKRLESASLNKPRGGSSGLADASGNRSGTGPHAPLLGGRSVDWLLCRDGKWRPVEPGSFPLAYEATARVGRLRAYGNGLDAETATQFAQAVMGG